MSTWTFRYITWTFVLLTVHRTTTIAVIASLHATVWCMYWFIMVDVRFLHTPQWIIFPYGKCTRSSEYNGLYKYRDKFAKKNNFFYNCFKNQWFLSYWFFHKPVKKFSQSTCAFDFHFIKVLELRYICIRNIILLEFGLVETCYLHLAKITS